MSTLSKDKQGGGNIQTPPDTEEDKGFQSKNYFITYHLQDGETFKQAFDKLEGLKPHCKDYIWAEEHGASGETPHIQGGFRLRTKGYANTLAKKYFKNGVTLRKLKDWRACVIYCSKENQEIHSSEVIPEPTVLWTKELMRPRQLKIAQMFMKKEHPLFGRKIHWFWEPQGNWGKSALATYMIDQMNAMEVSGKGADVLCGISTRIKETGQCPPIIIYDVPRSQAQYVSYASIEKIKDGKFFSGKYESAPLRFNKPWVVVFANTPPDLISTMSPDRWIITKLKEDAPNYYEGSEEDFQEDELDLMNISD